MKIKACKICGKWFVAKGRAEICGDDICKKGKERLNNIKKYQRRKAEGYDYNRFNIENPDKANKWNRLNPDKANKWNRLNPDKANKWNRLNPDKANKWNEGKLEEAYDEFHMLSDGYNSSLRINEKREVEGGALGSRDAEKEEIKYRVNNKKAWAKAEKEMQSLW